MLKLPEGSSISNQVLFRIESSRPSSPDTEKEFEVKRTKYRNREAFKELPLERREPLMNKVYNSINSAAHELLVKYRKEEAEHITEIVDRVVSWRVERLEVNPNREWVEAQSKNWSSLGDCVEQSGAFDELQKFYPQSEGLRKIKEEGLELRDEEAFELTDDEVKKRLEAESYEWMKEQMDKASVVE